MPRTEALPESVISVSLDGWMGAITFRLPRATLFVGDLDVNVDHSRYLKRPANGDKDTERSQYFRLARARWGENALQQFPTDTGTIGGTAGTKVALFASCDQ